jgi:hypothetical protein
MGQLANVLQQKVTAIKLFASSRNFFRICTLPNLPDLQSTEYFVPLSILCFQMMTSLQKLFEFAES